MIPPPPRSTLFPYTTLFRSLPLRDHRLDLIPVAEARHPRVQSHFARALHGPARSEEHTSELQSHVNLVCRLLLEKKKNRTKIPQRPNRPPSAICTYKHRTRT